MDQHKEWAMYDCSHCQKDGNCDLEDTEENWIMVDLDGVCMNLSGMGPDCQRCDVEY